MPTYRLFKGTPAEYNSLHNWVRRQLGTPSECENCGTTDAPRFEWANLSGDYLKDISDWARLCSRCHRLYDDPDQLKVVWTDECSHGHKITPENTYVYPNGERSCRICRTINHSKTNARRIIIGRNPVTYAEAYENGLTDINPEDKYECVECHRTYMGLRLNHHMSMMHGYTWVDQFNTARKDITNG